MGAIDEAGEEGEEDGAVEERSLPMARRGAKERRMSRPSLVSSSLRKLDKEARFVNPFGGKEAEAGVRVR